MNRKFSFISSIIFLIAIGFFIYILVKDQKHINTENRTFQDNVWIGLFLLILITGILVSTGCCYKNYYTTTTNFGKKNKRRLSFGNKINIIPGFIGNKTL
jgi:hypothetical protein